MQFLKLLLNFQLGSLAAMNNEVDTPHEHEEYKIE